MRESGINPLLALKKKNFDIFIYKCLLMENSEWVEIIKVIVSAITPIIVALIGVGYFTKYLDKKKIAKSRSLLMKQVHQDDIVHKALNELKGTYGCDRVYVWQFHNGGSYYTSLPMQKLSITYETNTKGLERKSENNQGHLISSFTRYIKNILEGHMFYSNILDVDDIGLRALSNSIGTKSHAAFPIYDNNSHLIGLLCMDWVFSEIPSKYLDDNGAFNDLFKTEITKEIKTLDEYIDYEQ